MKIDEKANQLIEQLNDYENECKNNLDSSQLKTSLTKIDEKIINVERDLAEWQKALKNFGPNEKEWTNIKQKCKDSNLNLIIETSDFKKQILVAKFDNYVSCVSNFKEIKLTSDIR